MGLFRNAFVGINVKVVQWTIAIESFHHSKRFKNSLQHGLP